MSDFTDDAFHFSAIYGERPGFDPRMNSFPFEFTWLDGPALKRYLDVLDAQPQLVGPPTPPGFVREEPESESASAAD